MSVQLTGKGAEKREFLQIERRQSLPEVAAAAGSRHIGAGRRRQRCC